MRKDETNKQIILWLWLGFGMILIQILLGAITRLTGSGLSITRWEIVTGILFPVSDAKWNYYFDLYKETPQYHKINQGMSLDQFKFIFFWEYFHRLWARLMGIVFVFPFCFFLFKKQISKKLFKRLLIIFLLAAFVASLGWIMVASGLIQRPWVNAYKLSFHLIAAVILLSFLFYTIIKTSNTDAIPLRSVVENLFLKLILSSIVIQILIGGVMAGMKAGLAAPTWPEINGVWIPQQIFQLSSLKDYLFGEYEVSHTGPVIIQFIHRTMAYLIFIFVLTFWFITKRNNYSYKSRISILLSLCLFQMFLGIWTTIHSVGFVPLWPAVFHQLFGIISLIYTLWLYLTLSPFQVKSD